MYKRQASDNLVTGSLSSAAKAVLENQQGETLTFDVFDQASTGPAWLTDAARGNVVQLERKGTERTELIN